MSVFSLSNRFHVDVHLFSNRSQMTSKRGKNKNVAHEALAECVTDVLPHSEVNMEAICQFHITKKQTTTKIASLFQTLST